MKALKTYSKLAAGLLLGIIATCSFATTQAGAQKNVGWPLFTDHIKINLESYEAGFKLLYSYHSDGLELNFDGCTDGGSCEFSLHGHPNGGNATLTIGSDWQHYCQFAFIDTQSMDDPEYQVVSCVGGRGADTYLHNDSTHHYSTKMW